eukprot:1285674-Rhodomonas_salina.2
MASRLPLVLRLILGDQIRCLRTEDGCRRAACRSRGIYTQAVQHGDALELTAHAMQCTCVLLLSCSCHTLCRKPFISLRLPSEKSLVSSAPIIPCNRRNGGGESTGGSEQQDRPRAGACLRVRSSLVEARQRAAETGVSARIFARTSSVPAQPARLSLTTLIARHQMTQAQCLQIVMPRWRAQM